MLCGMVDSWVQKFEVQKIVLYVVDVCVLVFELNVELLEDVCVDYELVIVIMFVFGWQEVLCDY